MSRQPIAGIRPVAPDVSILTVAGTLAGPDGNASDPIENVEGLRRAPWWSGGVSWRRSACATGHPWPGICPSAAVLAAKKAAASTLSDVDFRPYEFYVPYQCDWATPEDRPTLRAEGQALVEAQSAWHVSREIWAGPADLMNADQSNPNPTLMSEATAIGSEAVDPEAAVALLTQTYVDCTHGAGGVLHVPPILIPNLMHRALISRTGNVLNGPPGFVVSPGPGYPGPGPWGPDGALASPGRVWIYVSGPLEVAMTAPFVLPDDLEATYDRRMNRYELTAERRAIHRFDPCCVFAILTDIPNVGPDAS